MNKNMRPSQQGFTMIELIMVIVILGILAAVALPRFYDLQTDARKAKAQGLAGAVRSASAIAHSAALVQNLTGATGTITMEGANVTLRAGYPTANAAGIITAANIDATNDGVTLAGGGGGYGATINIRINGAPTPAQCQIAYQAPTALNTQPTVTVTQTGC